ncbi:MAG: hypothetical protein BWY64_02147 [bacterium ADurb.Bin363]|nr:MAG: hypothetical protein BWY64_02147 [bacterium ADurb.Bin363]
MSKYLTSDFEKALLKKGFQEYTTHHKMFLFYWKGKKTDIRTRISHGEKDFDDSLLNQRKKQIKLNTKQQIIDFINCPMSKEYYINFLINIGKIKPEKKDL